MSSLTLQAFNNHFMDFINDVVSVMPGDLELATAVTALGKLRKANPKIMINIFTEYVTTPYGEQIQDGNLHFFLQKDYSMDVQDSSQAGSILSKIDALKEPISNMSDENKAKVIKYLQNLCKLSHLYHV